MLWSAFLMGFLGSFHCMGMCAPIVLALPGKGVQYKLLYNIGRTITYVLLGLAVGLIGQGVAFAGLQQSLSVAVGVVMLITILFTKYKHFDLPTNGILNKVYIAVKIKLSPLFKSKSFFAPLFIGTLNGVLPCGLVYAALFTALSMGSLAGGANFMLFFGLGTIPLMFGLGVFSGFITPSLRTNLNKLVPYFLAIVAILLILRGLNLGIPYVSPHINGAGEMHMNHPM